MPIRCTSGASSIASSRATRSTGNKDRYRHAHRRVVRPERSSDEGRSLNPRKKNRTRNLGDQAPETTIARASSIAVQEQGCGVERAGNQPGFADGAVTGMADVGPHQATGWQTSVGRRVLVLRLSFMLAAFPLISLMQDTVVTASTIEDGRCLVCAARESVYSHPSQPDGPFTLQEPGGSHPLTAPCASPLINWVCSKRNVIVIGTVPINAPAAKMPQFTAKSFPI